MDNGDRYRWAADYADANSEGSAPPSYPPIPPLAELQIDPAELGTARLTPQCVVESYLYADVALLAAPGGSGKTTSALYEAVHIVRGAPLYGLRVHTQGSVVIVTAEDRRELLVARLGRIMEAMDLSDEERATVCERVLIWDVSGELCRLTELDRQGNVVLTGLADALVERFRDQPPVMVVLDPVVSFGAGERIVNDNEHSLILAARRIVRGLGCCVRLLCHTGKQGARDGVLDMYASRGGSALADGARMVAVLRTWEDEEKDKLTPPPGLSVGSDEQVIVLARPKLSYAPQQPHIWITRRGYEFKHFLATKPDPEAEARARVAQLERYLIEKFKAGYQFTQNMLEAMGDLKMKRQDLRDALATLLATARVIYASFPDKRARGAREYLHPVGAGAPPPPGPDSAAGEKSAKNRSSPRQGEQPLGGAPPYREKKGGAAKRAFLSPSDPRCASTPRRSDGAAGAANEAGDIQDHGTEPAAGHVRGDGLDQIEGENAALPEGQVEVEV